MELSVLIGVIGLAIGAISLWIGLVRFRERHGQPDIRAQTFGRPKKSASPNSDSEALQVNFHQPTDSSKWLVYEVRTDSRQSRWIAVLQGDRREGSWTNRIRYDPPVNRGSFLLHPDVSKQPRLSFHACLKSHVRIKRKVNIIPTEGITSLAY